MQKQEFESSTKQTISTVRLASLTFHLNLTSSALFNFNSNQSNSVINQIFDYFIANSTSSLFETTLNPLNNLTKFNLANKTDSPEAITTILSNHTFMFTNVSSKTAKPVDNLMPALFTSTSVGKMEYKLETITEATKLENFTLNRQHFESTKGLPFLIANFTNSATTETIPIFITTTSSTNTIIEVSSEKSNIENKTSSTVSAKTTKLNNDKSETQTTVCKKCLQKFETTKTITKATTLVKLKIFIAKM